MSEVGPIYGVELLTVLPLDGGMKQALPSRADLVKVREISERTVAGFEVLTEHFRRLREFVAGQPCDCYDAYGMRKSQPSDRCRLLYGHDNWEAFEANGLHRRA